MTQTTLLGNGAVATALADPEIVPGGAVAWRGGRVVAAGAEAELRARFPGAAFLDARGGVIMPGLVNLHHHVYSALARGLDPGVTMKDFGEVLDRLWWRLDRALANADLVVYATGNRAFGKAAMSELRDGAIVAGVTSADSEIVADDIAKYSRHELSNELTEYRGPGNRRFFLVNDGNAANFLHGAVIGPAIQLIEGEKLSAVSKLATADSSLEAGKLTELDYADRKVVAETWNEHFLLD